MSQGLVSLSNRLWKNHQTVAHLGQAGPGSKHEHQSMKDGVNERSQGQDLRMKDLTWSDSPVASLRRKMMIESD